VYVPTKSPVVEPLVVSPTIPLSVEYVLLKVVLCVYGPTPILLPLPVASITTVGVVRFVVFDSNATPKFPLLDVEEFIPILFFS
jgi:hypothetical protein